MAHYLDLKQFNAWSLNGRNAMAEHSQDTMYYKELNNVVLITRPNLDSYSDLTKMTYHIVDNFRGIYISRIQSRLFFCGI